MSSPKFYYIIPLIFKGDVIYNFEVVIARKFLFILNFVANFDIRSALPIIHNLSTNYTEHWSVFLRGVMIVKKDSQVKFFLINH